MGWRRPGLSPPPLKRAALESATQCILLADSTKFGAFERFKVAPIDLFDVIVSDSGLPLGGQSALREKGVELLLAAIGAAGDASD